MAIPTNGLDFYLPFDADMDEKIHSLTGTLSSSSAATYFMLSSDTAVGKFLRCIKTQGSSSYYLKYPGSESLMQYGTGDFSLSFWMRAPDWGNFTHVVFEKKYNDDYDGFVVFKVLDPLNLCCRLRKGSGEDSVDIVTASAADSDKFVHWCFIRDDSGGRWYCNGLREATSGGLVDACSEAGSNVDPSRAVGVNVSNSEIFKIGYSAAWSSKQAVFDLKALRIYNRALTDSEITELSKEFAGEGASGGTGVVINGLFLSAAVPKNGDKGLIIDGKYFIPFLAVSSSVSDSGSAVPSDSSSSSASSSLSTSVQVSDSGSQSVQASTIVMSTVGIGSFKVLAAQGTIEVRQDNGTPVYYSTFPVTVKLSSPASFVVVKGAVTQMDCSTLSMQQLNAGKHTTLQVLNVNVCGLQSLQINDCANLEQVFCQGNNLSGLSVSGTKMQHLNAA